MKTKLNVLKKELLARVAKEIKTFDFASKLSPERRARLERQYSKLRTTLTEVAEIVRQARKTSVAKPQTTTTARKAPKTSAKRAANTKAAPKPKAPPKPKTKSKTSSKKLRSK